MVCSAQIALHVLLSVFKDFRIRIILKMVLVHCRKQTEVPLQKTVRYLSTKLHLLELFVLDSVFKGYKICAQSCIPNTWTHRLCGGVMADKESSLLDTDWLKMAQNISIT